MNKHIQKTGEGERSHLMLTKHEQRSVLVSESVTAAIITEKSVRHNDSDKSIENEEHESLGTTLL